MKNPFTQHPRQVCMTYLQHMKLSLKFAIMFQVASVKAVVHAVTPCVFITSTSDTADNVQNILKASGCRDDNDDDKI